MDVQQNVQSNTVPLIPILAGFLTVIVGSSIIYFLFLKSSTMTSPAVVTTPTKIPSVATALPSTVVQTPKASGTPSDNEKMVDCGMAKDPSCFLNRMNGCLPVTVKMTGSDNITEIEMTILGIENEKCHFQRKLNGIMNLNCYFPKGTMNWDTIDQTFGNDKGLQKVVDDNCKSGW